MWMACESMLFTGAGAAWVNHARKCWSEHRHWKPEAADDKGIRKVVSKRDMLATKTEMVAMVAVLLEETSWSYRTINILKI